MACKFQRGDTVEVVNPIDWLNANFKKGHRGVVIDYERGISFPYKVMRKNGYAQCFNVKELKLIKKRKKTEKKYEN